MKLLPIALAVALAACPSAALADAVGERSAPTNAPIIPPQEDPPQLMVIPVPIPWLMVGGLVTYQNFRIGHLRNDVKLLGGYIWSNDFAFDPTFAAPTQPAGMDPWKVNSNHWRATAEWDVHLGPYWSLGPVASFLAAGLTQSGSYQPGLLGGCSASGGPLLTYVRLDDVAWPTRGTLARFTYLNGQHWGDQSLPFQKGGVNLVQYVHLARNQTLAARMTVQGGTSLAWLDKYSAGGGDFVRGYAWNRFTGDRLAAAGLEYRNLLMDDVLDPLGWHHPPLKLGIGVSAQVDAGRAWESAIPGAVPVGQDARFGGGVGLIATINRAPLGRVELNGSAEGAYLISELGTSF